MSHARHVKEHDSEQEKQESQQGFTELLCPFDLGYQICGRDVEKIAHPKGNQEMYVHALAQEVGYQTTERKRERRDEIVEQCLRARVSRMDNGAEVANFLGDFVQRCGEPRRESRPVICHENRAYGHPAQKIVQAVSSQ